MRATWPSRVPACSPVSQIGACCLPEEAASPPGRPCPGPELGSWRLPRRSRRSKVVMPEFHDGGSVPVMEEPCMSSHSSDSMLDQRLGSRPVTWAFWLKSRKYRFCMLDQDAGSVVTSWLLRSCSDSRRSRCRHTPGRDPVIWFRFKSKLSMLVRTLHCGGRDPARPRGSTMILSSSWLESRCMQQASL